MRKKTIILLLCSVLFLGLGQLYYLWSGDFRISYVLGTTENCEKILDEGITGLLKQPYHYLGHGHQVYAFLSEDEKYVLKLFKRDYFISTPWIHVFAPIPPFRKFFFVADSRREQKQAELLSGYIIADREMKEASGLIFFHPCKTAEWTIKTPLFLKGGFNETIDLNDYVFALQIKVVRTKEVLAKLLDAGDSETAKKRLFALFDLYLEGYRNGILDEDHNFLENTGFVGEKPIRQDAGRLTKQNGPIPQEEMKADLHNLIHKRLKSWLKKHYPQHLGIVDGMNKFFE